MNVARTDTLVPTIQTQRLRKMLDNKAQKRTRRMHMSKNQKVKS